MLQRASGPELCARRVILLWNPRIASCIIKRMKAALIIGVLLVVLGAAALVHRHFSYTTREKVLQIGPFQATADTEKRVEIPPLISVAAIAGS